MLVLFTVVLSSLWHAHYKKGSKRFATEEVLAQIFDGNSDVEEEISESEDLSETEDNAIDDPDWEFSYEEDSEDQSGVVSTLAENNGQQSSSTWTAKDANIKWSTSPHWRQGRLSSRWLQAPQDFLPH